MQADYNEQLLYEVDTIIEHAGGYGDREKPDMLKDQELTYQWDNPLSEMIERQKVQVIAEVSQLGQAVAALEAASTQSSALKQVDTVKTFRDGALALGAAKWLLDESDSEEAMDAQGEAQQMQNMIAAAPNVAQVIDSGVNAAKVASEIPIPAEPGIPLLPAPM